MRLLGINSGQPDLARTQFAVNRSVGAPARLPVVSKWSNDRNSDVRPRAARRKVRYPGVLSSATHVIRRGNHGGDATTGMLPHHRAIRPLNSSSAREISAGKTVALGNTVLSPLDSRASTPHRWNDGRLIGGNSIIEELPAPLPSRENDPDRQPESSLNAPMRYNLPAIGDQQESLDKPLDEDLRKDFESMLIGFGVTAQQQTQETLLQHIDYRFLEDTRRDRLRLGDAFSQLLVGSFQTRVQLFTIEEADAEIQIEQGTFDWIASLEQVFADQEQPTQSELDAGVNRPTLEQRDVQTSLGVSQLNRLGGQFSLNQDLQRSQTNSEFANAADQFSSQFSARYEQPLLRNAGRDAVTTRLQIAGFRSQQQRNQAATAIAEQMVSVAGAYWTIAQQRSSLLAIDDGIKLIEKLNEVLQLRSGIDASPFIRSRAPSVLKDLHRQAEDARRQLGQQQIEFSRLVNDRDPVTSLSIEIIPLDDPPNLQQTFQPDELVEEAVIRRPEVVSALREINITATELRLSKNQLLPSLSAFVQLQVQGLSESSDFASSLSQQRRSDFPSSQFGIVYQLPIQNRSARGNNRRALAAYRRSLLELEQAIADTRADVSTAVNELTSLRRQAKLVQERIQFNLDAIIALEVERLGLPPEQGSPTFTLNTLIDQIIQLTADRNEYFRLIRDFRIAQVQLNQATGSLIQASSLDGLIGDFQTTSVRHVH